MVVLFLLKNVGFTKYRRFGAFGLHELFDLFWFFFRDLEVTYPLVVKCSESNGAKTFP
jgi:hypothetical protein